MGLIFWSPIGRAVDCSICNVTICLIKAFPQTMKGLSKEDVTVLLVRLDVGVLGGQMPAGDQLSEGLGL